MSEVKRYHEFKNGVVENKHGMFVKFEDYAELKAQRDALAAEIERQECWEGAVIDALETAGIIRNDVTFTRSLLMELLKENLRSDSYLNSVRADGVEMAASDLFESTAIGHGMLMAFAAQLRTGEPS